MGGLCRGLWYIEGYFERESLRDCKGCPCYDAGVCEVLSGLETWRQCSGLAELIAYEGIRLYGVNARAIPSQQPALRTGHHPRKR